MVSHVRLGTQRFGQLLDIAGFHNLNTNVVTNPDHPSTRHRPRNVETEDSLFILLRQLHHRFWSRVERRRVPRRSQREEQRLGGDKDCNFIV